MKIFAKDKTVVFSVHQDNKGNWKATVTKNGKLIKETFCLNESQAKEARTMYRNRYWGYTMN